MDPDEKLEAFHGLLFQVVVALLALLISALAGLMGIALTWLAKVVLS
jgi:hypothetical protein